MNDSNNSHHFSPGFRNATFQPQNTNPPQFQRNEHVSHNAVNYGCSFHFNFSHPGTYNITIPTLPQQAYQWQNWGGGTQSEHRDSDSDSDRSHYEHSNCEHQNRSNNTYFVGSTPCVSKSPSGSHPNPQSNRQYGSPVGVPASSRTQLRFNVGERSHNDNPYSRSRSTLRSSMTPNQRSNRQY